MVNVAAEKVARRDWIMANPWPWSILGLCLCLAAWAMALAQADALTGLRVTAIFLGLVSVGAGVTIRLNSSRPPFLDHLSVSYRRGVLLVLALLFALVAVALTVLLVLRIYDVNPVGLRLNGLAILWLIVCPLSVAAAISCSADGHGPNRRGHGGRGEPASAYWPWHALWPPSARAGPFTIRTIRWSGIRRACSTGSSVM